MTASTRDVRMGDVLRLSRSPVEIDPDQEYVALGMRSFGNGVIQYAPTMGSELTRLRHFSFGVNSLALSNIKAWEGAIAVTSMDDVKAVASSRFLFYVPQRDDVDVRYLRYYFLSARGLAQIGQASPGSADRNRTLSTKSFENIIAPLPDLFEQCRVAEKLDAAMDKIAQVKVAKKTSTRLTLQHTDALFRAVDKYAPLSKALTESSDFVVIDPNATYRTAGILNRGRGLFQRPVINGSDTKYPRYNRLGKDQFVYSKLFGWEGSLAVVTEEFVGVHVSHEFPTFDIDPEVADVEYVTHLARWRGLHDSLKVQGTGMGSRRQRVNAGRLLAAVVPLPDLPEQRRIAKQLTLARKVADGGAAQVKELAALRHTLLDAAFSGQL